MSEVELANAEYWSHFWDTIEHWAFFGVVVTLAIEFMAMKLASPHKEIVENARKTALEELRQENLQLGLQLESERRERESLLIRIIRRDVDLVEFNGISFEPIRGVTVLFRTLPNNEEAEAVAKRLKLTFNSARWNMVEDEPPDGPGEVFPTGITIVVNNGEPPAGDMANTAANAVIAELNRVGVRARLWHNENGLPVNTFRIIVGSTDRLPNLDMPKVKAVPFGDEQQSDKK